MEGSFSKLIRLHTTLRNRRSPIASDVLRERLDCSKPTLHRIIGTLRDRFHAPIINVPGRGYFYDRSKGEFELPGLWLNAEELAALLAMDALLAPIEPGILRDAVGPLRQRLQQILTDSGTSQAITAQSIAQRVRLLPQQSRSVAPTSFAKIVTATLEQRRLQLRYRGRERDQETEREVSPLHVVRYRENWYLDAYCHRAEALRTFSVDRILDCEKLTEPCSVIADDLVKEHFESSYGIFAGPAKHQAKLLFTPERARWVAAEQWHPSQAGQFRTDGSYELTVPYADERELIGDILRHGKHVQVLAPRALQIAMRTELQQAAEQYAETPDEPGNKRNRRRRITK